MNPKSELSINHPDHPQNPYYTQLKWMSNPEVRDAMYRDRCRISCLESEVVRLGGNLYPASRLTDEQAEAAHQTALAAFGLKPYPESEFKDDLRRMHNELTDSIGDEDYR